jgi:lipoyl(octanoyl) transferase
LERDGLTRPVRLYRFPQRYVPYNLASAWQRETAAAVRTGDAPETLALLEHEPVFTFGRHPRYEHLIMDRDDLINRGATISESDRGGDMTFHGPGQLVAYPVLDLRAHRMRPRAYVHALEAAVIETLHRFGLRGERRDGLPGVWCGAAKIAAIGVRIEGGVATHGLALNVKTDLTWFEAIVPCGLRDASVTSVERELGASPGVETVADAFVTAFEAVFGCAIERTIPERELVTIDGR